MSDSEKPTLLIIDGHSLAFRAFYALPVDSFVNREGQHTNAIHGFIAMFINLLQQQKPTHLAVAFDISRYSFRTREYPEYKGTRGETPSEFAGQVPLLEEALHAMNVTTIAKEDYEADDILATLARQGAEQGFKVLIVSGDRDTIQLVNDDVTLLYPNVRGVSELKVYDPAAVREKYGIEPHEYPEIAALVGETSDNLIGIDKVGEKTAVKWVQQYGTVENIVAHADEIKGVVGQNLRDQKENALRNRRLNQLLDDVELPVGPADLERKPLNEGAVRDIFARLQFKTLLDRLMKTAAEEGMLDGVAAATQVGDAGAVSAPAVRTMVDEELENWLSKASAGGTAVAVQLEVGPAGISGFGLAVADDSVYVPWTAGRKDYEALETWLASSAPKYFFHAKPQFKSLSRAGFVVDGLAFDTRIASWLVKPGAAPQSLAEQVYEVLGETLPVSDPNQLVPINDAVSPATEAWFIRRVAEGQMIALDEGTRAVLDDIELPLVAVLAEMELSGVSIDSEVLARLRGQLTDKANDFAAQAYAQIGHEINLGSPKQLQQVLFEELGMPKTRATKTGYSTDAGSLADLQEKNPHPFLGLLLQHRDATKLKQIVETLERSVETRWTHPHDLRPDGHQHRPHLVERPEPAEHPDPDGGGARDPLRVHAGRRFRDAAHGRLLADRDADHGAPVRRSRPDRGVQRGRRPAPLRRFARVRRFAGRGDLRDAHQGEGDVVRSRLRPQRVRTLQAAPDRNVRGPAADDATTSSGSARCATTCATSSSRPASTGSPRRSSGEGGRSPT